MFDNIAFRKLSCSARHTLMTIMHLRPQFDNEGYALKVGGIVVTPQELEEYTAIPSRRQELAVLELKNAGFLAEVSGVLFYTGLSETVFGGELTISQPCDPTGAERQRRFRERRKSGEITVTRNVTRNALRNGEKAVRCNVTVTPLRNALLPVTDDSRNESDDGRPPVRKANALLTAPPNIDFGPLEPDVSIYAQNAAAENKSGKITEGRLLAIRRELLAVKEQIGDDSAFAFGLKTANSKGVANPNYVKKAAKNAPKNDGFAFQNDSKTVQKMQVLA